MPQSFDRDFSDLPITVAQCAGQWFDTALVPHLAQGNDGFAADDPVGITQQIDLDVDFILYLFFVERGSILTDR